MTIAQFTIDAAPALTVFGPMGLMLAWFALRAEKVFTKLADLAHRIDGLTKALLVDMIEREHTGSAVKTYAKEQIARIDARSAKEDKK